MIQTVMHRIPLSEALQEKVAANRYAYEQARKFGSAPSYPQFVNDLFKQMSLVEVEDLLKLIDAQDDKVPGELIRMLSSGNPSWSMMHAGVGCAGEGGELLDAIKKVCLYRKDWNTPDKKTNQTPLENVIEELGDHRFYYRKILNILGLTDEDVEACNYAKLAERYKSGKYSDQQAQDRADKATTEALPVAQAVQAPTAAATPAQPAALGVAAPAADTPRKFLGQHSVTDQMAGERAAAEALRNGWNQYVEKVMSSLRAELDKLPDSTRLKFLKGEYETNVTIKQAEKPAEVVQHVPSTDSEGGNT